MHSKSNFVFELEIKHNGSNDMQVHPNLNETGNESDIILLKEYK